MRIGRSQFDRTVKAVQDSGVDKALDDILRSGRGGRPRKTQMDVYVAAMILVVLTGRKLTLVNVLNLLTKDQAHSTQIYYGTRWSKEEGDCLTYRQMTYPLDALKSKLTADGKTDDENLQSLMDMVMSTSLPTHVPAMTALALDATGMQSWARGKSDGRIREDANKDASEQKADKAPPVLTTANKSLCSFDTDATWGYRTKTYSNGSSMVFGYNMISVVGIPAVGDIKDRAPILTQAIRVRAANAGVVKPGLELLDSYSQKHPGLSEVLNDRAWSYALSESWAAPVRERGVEQVHDLHPNDHGVRDFEGIRMVDGAPHCPAMPDELVRISRPPRFSVSPLRKNPTSEQKMQHAADTAALDGFRANIVERQTWAFRRVAGPDLNGKERWECPAQAGKRICANCPISQSFDEGAPTVDNPPAQAGRPKCCTQRTVTIPGTVTPKIRQRMYWGSDEWITSFNRRTHVEGSYGNLKNTNTENINRGWCCVVGLVKTSLLLAVAVTASNIRLLRAWAKRNKDFTHPMSIPEPDYEPWEAIDDNDQVLTHDPPAPAVA